MNGFTDKNAPKSGPLCGMSGMRPLQAHCHAGLGTLYTTTDQWEQARAELSAAIALYRAMEMTFWLKQTEDTLAQALHDC
jgi:uncharacterized protein HemY